MPEETKPTELQIFTDEELENIRIFKLSNGETIIGVLAGQDSKNRLAIVRRPSKLSAIQNPNGSGVSYVMMKWTVFSKSDMHLLDMNHILITYQVNSEMVLFFVKSVRAQIMEEIEEAKGPQEAKFEWPDWMDKDGVVKN